MPRLVRVSLAISESFLLQRLTKGGFEIRTAEYGLSAFSSLAGCNWFGFKCFSELTSWVVNAKHSFRAVPRSPVRRLIFVTFCKPRLETTTRKPTRQHHQPASAQLGTAAPVPAPARARGCRNSRPSPPTAQPPPGCPTLPAGTRLRADMWDGCVLCCRSRA